MRVALFGLGLMGLPMAGNLARAGFDVRAWNRSPRELPDLPNLQLSPTVRAACTAADVVVTMLPDLPQVDDLCQGPDGVFATTSTATLIVMGTVSPTALRDWADLGPVGSGQLAKACNQVVVATTLTALGEAVALARADGLDVQVLLELLSGGLTGSRALEVKRERLTSNDFEPGGRSDFQHKDLGFAVESARALGVYLPVTAAVDQLFGAMRWTGHGGDDHSGVVQMIERLSRA